MSRIKLALDLVKDLKKLTESIEVLARAMEAGRAGEGVSLSQEKESGESITIGQVKEVLFARIKEGKADAVRELIKRYGGTKLTEVDPSKYGDLVREAKCL